MTRARIVTLVVLVLLPIAFLVGAVMGAALASQGKDASAPETQTKLAVIEAGIALFFLITAFIVGGATAKKPKRPILTPNIGTP